MVAVCKVCFFFHWISESVNFWLDRWCDERVMKDLFPVIHSIAQDMQAKVSDYLSWHNDKMLWSVIFLRSLQDWEVEVYTAFIALLYNHKVKREEGDNMRWNHTKSGLFEVRSY